jgi:hypothetical protein
VNPEPDTIVKLITAFVCVTTPYLVVSFTIYGIYDFFKGEGGR